MKRYILLLMAVYCLFPVSAQQSIKEIVEEPLCLVAPDSAQKTKQLVILQTRDRKSTRLNSSHTQKSRMPSSA